MSAKDAKQGSATTAIADRIFKDIEAASLVGLDRWKIVQMVSGVGGECVSGALVYQQDDVRAICISVPLLRMSHERIGAILVCRPPIAPYYPPTHHHHTHTLTPTHTLPLPRPMYKAETTTTTNVQSRRAH